MCNKKDNLEKVSPNFAVIGAQKSASTFLQKGLQAHSNIFIPSGELATFEDPYFANYEPESFSANFEKGQNAKAVGFKRPNYLHEAVVPERLANHLPGIKLIVSLRDPIERAVSAYFHQVRHNFAPLVEVNKGINEILTGRWSEEYPRTSQIIEYGRYHEQIHRYLKYFDQEDFFLTTYRDLTTRSEEVFRSIHNFLGVRRERLPASSKSSAQTGVYSKTRLKVARFVNRIQFEYFYGGQRLKPRRDIGLLGCATVWTLRNLNRYVLSLLETGQPPLQKGVHEELVSYYRSDMEQLRSTFDLDIEHWSVFSNGN